MTNWNEIWDINAKKGNEHTIINGFEHDENKIESSELFQYLVKNNNIEKHESILEVGCGSGRIAQHFIKEGYIYYGVDKSLNMINKFKDILNYNNVQQISNNKLPFQNNSFDIIICYSVIQYLNNLEEFNNLLDELIRVSKRIIYIGDLESMDHSISNSKHYNYNSNLKHLIISQEYIKSINLKYEININSLFCTRKSRYNCIINKNNYVFEKKIYNN